MDPERQGGQSSGTLRPSEALNRFAPSGTVVSAGRAPAQRLATRFGFRVGQIRLLIGPDTISEVVSQPAVYPIPNMPSWLLGLMNQRGNLLPVFDFHQLFDDAGGAERRTVLVLDRGIDAVGIPIDGLPQSVVTTERMRRLPPLPQVVQPYVVDAFAQDGSIWLDFDHRPFFAALGRRIAE